MTWPVHLNCAIWRWLYKTASVIQNGQWLYKKVNGYTKQSVVIQNRLYKTVNDYIMNTIMNVITLAVLNYINRKKVLHVGINVFLLA